MVSHIHSSHEYDVPPTEVHTSLLYLLVSVQFAAIIICVLLVLALSIPLLIQLKNGTFHQRSSVIGSSQRRRSSQRTRQKESPYSTYNLYLVYLAVVDLGYLVPKMVALWMNANQKYNPRFYAGLLMPESPPNTDEYYPSVGYIVGCPYMAANMWINAVVAHQVLVLLQKSHRAQPISQPSLTRVNLQAGGVIIASILLGIYNYYDVINNGLVDRGKAYWTIRILIVFFIPFVYVMGLTILVKWRGYIPPTKGSTPRDRAVRGLAFYFFRVATVFLTVWLPFWMIGVTIVIPCHGGVGNKQRAFTFVVDILMSSQPILTFFMILTKPDVKKYIKRLVTLTYLFGDSNCCRFGGCNYCRNMKLNDTTTIKTNDTTNVTDSEIADESSPGTKTVHILGYSFEDTADDDSNASTLYASANGGTEEEVDRGINNTIGNSGDDAASVIENEDVNHDKDDNDEEENENDIEANTPFDIETENP